MDEKEVQTVDVAAIAKAAADEAVKAYRAQLEAEPPRKAAGVVVEDEADNAVKKAPFKGLGEFLMAVKDARGNRDPRLAALHSEDGYSLNGAMGDGFVGGLTKTAFKSAWKQTGLNEGNNAQGGFLVDTDRSASIMQRVYDVGELLRRVDMVGVSANSNGMTFRGVNETSRADGSRMGGVRAYWLAEGGAKTASQPAFRELELRLRKVAALCYATDELLQDANALESWIMSNLPEELNFVVEDSIFNGTGVGMPLGLMQSITPAGCVISVAKEVGQAADTVVSQNVLKMWARLYNRSRRNAVWFINQDLLPQLYQMSQAVGTGGLPVFMPPGGLSGSPYATLMGRPIVEVEYAQTVGDAGDIILADLSQYQMIEKGGIQAASSIHVNFIYDETVFRFVYRVDGQPKWNLDLTPKNGTNTVSPFIILDERA